MLDTCRENDGVAQAKVTAYRKTEWDCSLFKINLLKKRTMKKRLRETLSMINYPSIYTFTASVLDSIKINQNRPMASSASFSLQFTLMRSSNMPFMDDGTICLLFMQKIRWSGDHVTWLTDRQAVDSVLGCQAGKLWTCWLLGLDRQGVCTVYGC